MMMKVLRKTSTITNQNQAGVCEKKLFWKLHHLQIELDDDDSVDDNDNDDEGVEKPEPSRTLQYC